jgi:hypothetical protein
MIRSALWKDEGETLRLHPPFTRARSEWSAIEATFESHAHASGHGWWPVVASRDAVHASAVDRHLIRELGGPADFSRPGSAEPTPAFELAPPPPLPSAMEPPLTRRRLLELVKDQRGRTRQELVAQYWNNNVVREFVSTVVKGAPDSSPEFTVGAIVAAGARDASLWPDVLARAKCGNRVAESCLRRWPDPRGAEFFAQALAPEAKSFLGPPLLSNAIMHFVLCGAGQGLDYLTARLGHPFAAAATHEPVRRARLMVGYAIFGEMDVYDFQPRNEWLEYVAACLLAEPIAEDETTWASRGLRLLTRLTDARCPVVVWRLIRDDVHDEEDVVPALTAVRSDDAREATQWLLEQTRRTSGGAKGERAIAARRMENLLQQAASQLS